MCENDLQNFYTCKTKPCENLGYCTPQGTCICPSTATGKFCEILVATTPFIYTTTSTPVQLDYCQTTSCQNNGACVSLTASSGFCNCIKLILK